MLFLTRQPHSGSPALTMEFDLINGPFSHPVLPWLLLWEQVPQRYQPRISSWVGFMSFMCVQPTSATRAKVWPSGPAAWFRTAFELRMVFIDVYRQETHQDFKGQRQKTPETLGDPKPEVEVGRLYQSILPSASPESWVLAMGQDPYLEPHDRSFLHVWGAIPL